MENNKLPTQYKKRTNPLWRDIHRFSKRKYLMAFLLLLIGMFGVIIPVIPGILFVLLAIALVKPGFMAKIRAKMKKWANS